MKESQIIDGAALVYDYITRCKAASMIEEAECRMGISIPTDRSHGAWVREAEKAIAIGDDLQQNYGVSTMQLNTYFDTGLAEGIEEVRLMTDDECRRFMRDLEA